MQNKIKKLIERKQICSGCEKCINIGNCTVDTALEVCSKKPETVLGMPLQCVKYPIETQLKWLSCDKETIKEVMDIKEFPISCFRDKLYNDCLYNDFCVCNKCKQLYMPVSNEETIICPDCGSENVVTLKEKLENKCIDNMELFITGNTPIFNLYEIRVVATKKKTDIVIDFYTDRLKGTNLHRIDSKTFHSDRFTKKNIYDLACNYLNENYEEIVERYK